MYSFGQPSESQCSNDVFDDADAVDFLAVDQPFANQLTLHIFAAVAEDEARRISERTKAALRAAKARGVKLGSPNAATTISAARDARSRYARSAAGPIKMIIADIQRAGVTSLSEIAKALQARGIRRGGQADRRRHAAH